MLYPFTPETAPTRLRVPNDNSCLFYAVAYLCDESLDETAATTAAKAAELRGVCRDAAAADPDPETRALILGQLPAFLESVTRILAAGNTLEVALGQAARESPEPLRSLFIRVGRQVRLGAAVEEVLAEAAEIHRIRDLQVIALAASINRRYGGSLRSVLRSLVQAIRSRDTAQRELRALTAETRFSAMVLAVIPVGLSLYILLQNPGYYAQMWDSTGGRWTLIASVMLQLSGVLVIWRMMQSTEDAN